MAYFDHGSKYRGCIVHIETYEHDLFADLVNRAEWHEVIESDLKVHRLGAASACTCLLRELLVDIFLKLRRLSREWAMSLAAFDRSIPRSFTLAARTSFGPSSSGFISMTLKWNLLPSSI